MRSQTIPGFYDDFWTDRIWSMKPVVEYVGPMPGSPRDYYRLAKRGPQSSFVYVLRSVATDVLYIGMSANPGSRFDKHRRREWWGEVSDLTLVSVRGVNRIHARRKALALELAAIQNNGPIYNVAGVGI